MTYSHGGLVVPISLWLLWRCRHEVAPRTGRRADGACSGSCSRASSGSSRGSRASWCVQQLAVVAMVSSVVLAVLGWPAYRQLAFPLAFLVFAVPFGRGLVPALMQVTADITATALKWTGVPVFRNGMLLSIPGGDFEVARACSGLNYLMTGVVLGTLYAYLTYTGLAQAPGVRGRDRGGADRGERHPRVPDGRHRALDRHALWHRLRSHRLRAGALPRRDRGDVLARAALARSAAACRTRRGHAAKPDAPRRVADLAVAACVAADRRHPVVPVLRDGALERQAGDAESRSSRCLRARDHGRGRAMSRAHGDQNSLVPQWSARRPMSTFRGRQRRALRRRVRARPDRGSGDDLLPQPDLPAGTSQPARRAARVPGHRRSMARRSPRAS